MLFELGTAEKLIVVTSVKFFKPRRESVEKLTPERTVTTLVFHTLIATEKQHVTDLVFAVVVSVAFFFGAKMTIRNDFITNSFT